MGVFNTTIIQLACTYGKIVKYSHCVVYHSLLYDPDQAQDTQVFSVKLSINTGQAAGEKKQNPVAIVFKYRSVWFLVLFNSTVHDQVLLFFFVVLLFAAHVYCAINHCICFLFSQTIV